MTTRLFALLHAFHRRLARPAARSASLAGGAALFGALVVAPPILNRHIGLASSVPAKDSHVTAPVREIRLTFTGRIDVTKAGVDLLTAEGKAVALDSLRAVLDSPRVAVARVPGSLAAGTYTVKWRAVAADGANGSGSFNFMYMPSSGETRH